MAKHSKYSKRIMSPNYLALEGRNVVFFSFCETTRSLLGNFATVSTPHSTTSTG